MTQTQARGDVRLTAPTRDGNGWSRTWTRVIAGVLYSFVAVVMPITGELRFTASRSKRNLPERPLFGADWQRLHSITVKAETHGALTWSRTRPGLYVGARRGEAQFEVIRDPNANRDNTWCVRLAGTTKTITGHRLLKTAQRVAERYTGKRDAEALVARLAAQADAMYGECTGAVDEQTLGRPRAHDGTVGTYRFASGAADARLCHAHGDAYGDLATRIADDPATAPATGSNHYTRDGMSAGCGEMYSTDTLTSDGLRVNCERCLAIMAAARDVRRGDTDDLPERAAAQGFDLVVVPGRRMPIELRSGGVLRMNFADREMCRQWLADAAAVTIARHNQLADEITEYRARMGSWPALEQVLGAGWATEVVLAAVDARVVEQHGRRYLTTPAGYVAAFYHGHKTWPSLSKVVQLGADLDVVQLAIDAGRLEHREIGDVRLLMLPVPNPEQPVAVDDVVTVTPDRQGRQFDVIEVFEPDDMVRVHPRRMLTVDDGPRWVSRTYVRRVPAAIVLPGDVDDDDQGDGGTDPQPAGPTGCPAGPACSGAAFPGHDAHPVPGQQPGAIAKCEHGFMVEGNIETCPNGCPQQRIGVLDASTVAARAAGPADHAVALRCAEATAGTGAMVHVVVDGAGLVVDGHDIDQCPAAPMLADRAHRAYAEALTEHTEALGRGDVGRASVIANMLPLARQNAGDLGVDVEAVERAHGPRPVDPSVRARCNHGWIVELRSVGWWHSLRDTLCTDPEPMIVAPAPAPEQPRTIADMIMPAMPGEYRRVLSHLLAPFGFAAPEGIDKLVPSDANPEAFLVHDVTGIALGAHDRFVRMSYPAEHAGEGDGDLGEAFVDMAYGTSFETVADLAIGLSQRLMRVAHLNHMHDIADRLREIAGPDVGASPTVEVRRVELHRLAADLAGVDTECAAAGYARRATAVLTGVMVKLVELGERGEQVDPELLRSLALVTAEAMTAPPADVEQLVEHIRKGADAAIVADETLTPADVDALVETLVGAGWQLAGEPEFVLGKRVRYLVPPTAVEAGVTRDGLPAAAPRHQAPEGALFVSCKLHGADCRSAQNGRPCSGMPAPAPGWKLDDDGLLRFEDHMIGSPEGELVDVAGYLVCGCHGSQRVHTCDVYAEPPAAPED